MDSDTGAPTSRCLSLAVIHAIAERKGVDPMGLEPISTTIDPDALDALFTGGRGHIVLEYAGCEVTVDSDGTVREIRDLDSSEL